MPMPLIKEEIIESIRTQSLRSSKNSHLYAVDVMKEMEKENPYLHEAIKETITMFVKKFDLNLNDYNDYNFIVNIANLTTSVYSSIKQQIICNDLEE